MYDLLEKMLAKRRETNAGCKSISGSTLVLMSEEILFSKCTHLSFQENVYDLTLVGSVSGKSVSLGKKF